MIRELDTTLLRGDKVGIIGPNGCGKTTLVRLLLGELEPTAGEVRRGTRLEIAYFDQQRAVLDEDATVQDNAAGGREHIEIGGQSRHVLSYLQDFLFPPHRARQPVRALSGGERNRLLLARLFSQPANLLVLDEPTNDLDTETLELLEDRLLAFSGTVIVVSHDRAFLDAVVTQTLAYEGEGRFREYAGGYSDWLSQRPASQQRQGTSTPAGYQGSSAQAQKADRGPGGERHDNQDAARPPRGSRPAKRLTRHEEHELTALPERIEALEAEQEQVHQELADPALYQDRDKRLEALRERLVDIEDRLARSYERWEELEARSQGA